MKPGQWGWTFGELVASWRAAETAGFDVLACFDHVSAAPEGVTAWDGPSLLGAMSAHTERIRLAIHVVNASLRNPVLLAGQIAVAQASSGGRVEVGIGAGSHSFARHDHDAIGVPFPPYAERVRRLDAYARLLPALWRGESVTDPAAGLQEASLGPLNIDPPRVFVGGSSAAALAIAARYADGWHAPGEEEQFAERVRRLDILSREHGRRRIEKSIQLRAPSFDGLRERIDRLAGFGASTVIVVLDRDQRGPEWVERLASAVLKGAGPDRRPRGSRR